ncbi:MAG: GrpB family protein [Rhabdochlamydiaceae bacterium]|nr:GrpB family protein [Rhabdochlamydiaceae bacterium]
MKKYVYKPYSTLFPELFSKEKTRIEAILKEAFAIEHIGSTAIVGLGGKGIIDIGITVRKEHMDLASKQLQQLGYEYKPNFSTAQRFYFVIFLPDPEEGTRRYHIHLTYPESSEWKELIGFRDYLRDHPEAVEEYAALKKHAAEEANQMGDRYRKLKDPIFKKIHALMQKRA